MKNFLLLLLRNIWNFIKFSLLILIIVPLEYFLSTKIYINLPFPVEYENIILRIFTYIYLYIFPFVILLIGFWKKYIIFSKSNKLQNIFSIIFLVLTICLTKSVQELTIGFFFTTIF